jgi:hypothetical protein
MIWQNRNKSRMRNFHNKRGIYGTVIWLVLLKGLSHKVDLDFGEMYG